MHKQVYAVNRGVSNRAVRPACKKCRCTTKRGSSDDFLPPPPLPSSNTITPSMFETTLANIRDRWAEGLRALSYSARYPHQIIEYVHLLKEVREQGQHYTVDKKMTEDQLTLSDKDISDFLNAEIENLNKILNNVEASQHKVSHDDETNN